MIKDCKDDDITHNNDETPLKNINNEKKSLEKEEVTLKDKESEEVINIEDAPEKDTLENNITDTTNITDEEKAFIRKYEFKENVLKRIKSLSLKELSDEEIIQIAKDLEVEDFAKHVTRIFNRKKYLIQAIKSSQEKYKNDLENLFIKAKDFGIENFEKLSKYDLEKAVKKAKEKKEENDSQENDISRQYEEYRKGRVQFLLQPSKYFGVSVNKDLLLEGEEDPLPPLNEDDRILFFPIDPLTTFTYWDLKFDTLNYLRSQNIDTLVLKINDVSDINYNGFNAHHSWYETCSISLDSYYVNIPFDDRTYCIDLGFMRDNIFYPIAMSNTVYVARRKPSQKIEDYFVVVDYSRPIEHNQLSDSNEVENISYKPYVPYIPYVAPVYSKQDTAQDYNPYFEFKNPEEKQEYIPYIEPLNLFEFEQEFEQETDSPREYIITTPQFISLPSTESQEISQMTGIYEEYEPSSSQFIEYLTRIPGTEYFEKFEYLIDGETWNKIMNFPEYILKEFSKTYYHSYPTYHIKYSVPYTRLFRTVMYGPKVIHDVLYKISWGKWSKKFIGGSEQFMYMGASEAFIGGSEEYMGASEAFIENQGEFMGGSEFFGGSEKRYIGASELLGKFMGASESQYLGASQFMGGSESFIGASGKYSDSAEKFVGGSERYFGSSEQFAGGSEQLFISRDNFIDDIEIPQDISRNLQSFWWKYI